MHSGTIIFYYPSGRNSFWVSFCHNEIQKSIKYRIKRAGNIILLCSVKIFFKNHWPWLSTVEYKLKYMCQPWLMRLKYLKNHKRTCISFPNLWEPCHRLTHNGKVTLTLMTYLPTACRQVHHLSQLQTTNETYTVRHHLKQRNAVCWPWNLCRSRENCMYIL